MTKNTIIEKKKINNSIEECEAAYINAINILTKRHGANSKKLKNHHVVADLMIESGIKKNIAHTYLNDKEISTEKFKKEKVAELKPKEKFNESKLNANNFQDVQNGNEKKKIENKPKSNIFKLRSEKSKLEKKGLKKLKKNRISNKLRYKIHIRIKANNVFCILTKRKTNKELHSCNAGSYKIPTSKRKLKHTYLLILNKFFLNTRKIMAEGMKEIQKKRKERKRIKPGVHIVLSSPRYLRRKVLRSIKYHFRHRTSPFLFEIKDKKVFNGCRPPKKIRKKRRFRRLYKE